MLFGWFYDVSQAANLQGAQVFGKIYTGTLERERRYPGCPSVCGRHSCPLWSEESDWNTGRFRIEPHRRNKEIWTMNWDGTIRKPLTHYGTISAFPSVSPDGIRSRVHVLAARIAAHHDRSLLDSKSRVPFYNQRASMNCCLSFSPDGNMSSFPRRRPAVQPNCIWRIRTAVVCTAWPLALD